MIYNIGIDIVHIPKLKKAVERWGNKLKKRIFTKGELAYCENRRFSEQHLAVRFAAKEAFIKALGRRVRSKEIEIKKNNSGRPYVVSNAQLPDPNLKHLTHLTLSHDGDYCIAQVILEVHEQ
jgi:holo-[acyl-carrier protein] synthase